MSAPLLLTIAEARRLLTPDVRDLLVLLAHTPECYTPDALINAGVPSRLVGAMLADYTRPEHATTRLCRASTSKPCRRVETRSYVFSPDIAGYLRGWA